MLYFFVVVVFGLVKCALDCQLPGYIKFLMTTLTLPLLDAVDFKLLVG